MFANAAKTDKTRKILPPASNHSPTLCLVRASSIPPWSASCTGPSCSPHWRQYFCFRSFSALHRGQYMERLHFRLCFNSSAGELTSAIERRGTNQRIERHKQATCKVHLRASYAARRQMARSNSFGHTQRLAKAFRDAILDRWL